MLAPGGRIIIVGFNPISLFGLRRGYAKCIDDDLSQRRFINPIRLFDWLELLGLSLEVKPEYLEYGLPFGTSKGSSLWPASLCNGHRLKQLRQWIRRLPLGGVLAITLLRALADDPVPTKRRRGSRLAPAGLSEGSEFAREKGRSLMPEVDIFTDGACRGQSRPGGWAKARRAARQC